MQSEQPFIAIVAELEQLLRSDRQSIPSAHTLIFDFCPGIFEPDGKNVEWQATITLHNGAWVAHGATLEQAAHQLLYVLHHPELYNNPEDD